MHRVGQERARWLAELAAALASALAILRELPSNENGNDRDALASHLNGAIAEVDALRRGGNRPVGTAFDPDWTKFRTAAPRRED
jgi:hypothetical protein